MAKKLVYGLEWNEETDPLEIEFQFIRAGGYYNLGGGRYGEGLFHHYKAAQMLLWPEGEDHHDWSDQMLSEILANRITVIAGCRDSGKTHVALARYGLTDYFCFPNDTLILMSSTHAQGLQLRVYGDVKDLLERAKALRPKLPGNVVDSKYGIFTDQLGPGFTIRDMRKGIICFPAGTQVDTPNGKRNIESIKVGESVANAVGVGRVLSRFRRIAPLLMRTTLKDGRYIDATPEHPILTQRGWIEIRDITTCDRVFSVDETMRALPQTIGVGLPKQEVLFRALQNQIVAKKLCALPKDFSSNLALGQSNHWSVLQHALRISLASQSLQAANREAEVQWLWQNNAFGSREQIFLLGWLPESTRASALPAVRKLFHLNSGIDHKAEDKILFSKMQAQSYRPCLFKVSPANHQGGIASLERVASSNFALSFKDRTKNKRWEKPLVRDRHCVSEVETRNRSRWRDSQRTNEIRKGPEPNEDIRGTWVDCVEVLEPTGDQRFDKSEGGYPVYNIEVGGHPSYSVNGIVVHNCVPCIGGEGEWLEGLEKFIGVKQKRRRLLGDEVQFMDAAYLNVMANLDKGDFKGVFCGNFLGRGDPLDQLAEPVSGWSSLPEPTKTTTWENNLGGRTLNLIGTDSPNFKFPKDEPARYPYLISWDDAERVAKRYRTDSLQYWSQIKGVRKPDLMAHRILTMDICKKFDAFKECIWEGGTIVKIYALDAAYGGDRAVGGMIEFGREVGGIMVIKCGKQRTIPIRISADAGTAEQQLAIGVKADIGVLGIPSENVFFDAGMRATLGVVMANQVGPDVNAINFGGPATKRPVSSVDFVFDDKTRERRLKRCDEAYSKFVTEINYSVRMAVEARQMREIPEEVVREFEMREWTEVAGDRIELETKLETKKRMGRSPDFADWLAIGVEGARRRGFQIEGLNDNAPGAEQEDWLQKAQDKSNQQKKKTELNYQV